MPDAIEVRFLLPATSEEASFERTLTCIGESDDYERIESGTDVMGRSRAHVSLAGIDVKIVFDDESSKHPNGTLGKIRVQDSKLDDASTLEDDGALREVVEFATAVYDSVADLGVFVSSVEGGQGPLVPLDDGNPSSREREFITWFDVYPPEEVERIGRDRLLSAPAPHVEELPDGAILIVSKHPLSSESMDDVADHVGIPTWQDVQR